MKHIITIALLLQTAMAFAQQKVVMFYDQNWTNVASNDPTAVFYRKAYIHQVEGRFRFEGKVQDYYVLGKPQMTGYYLQGKKHGNFKFYYADGKLEKKGTYLKDKKQGKWSYWYPNGKLKQIIEYKDNDFRVLEFAEEDGTKLVKNGNGLWITYAYLERHKMSKVKGNVVNGKRHGKWRYFYADEAKGLLFSQKYKEGVLVKEIAGKIKPRQNFNRYEPYGKFKTTEKFSSNQMVELAGGKKGYKLAMYDAAELQKKPSILMGMHLVPTDSTDQKVYTKVDQPAYPIGGSHKMYMSFIHKIKSYPRPGKKYKLLVITFTVEKDGNLSDFRVVKSGGKKYDTEAMNQMPHLPKFIPAIHQGKKVRSLSSIQIRYQKQ